MMASHHKEEIKRIEEKVPEPEPDLDQMARQIQNWLKFRNFYNQMDFNLDQCLAITKAMVGLNNLSGGFDLAKKLLPRRQKARG